MLIRWPYLLSNNQMNQQIILLSELTQTLWWMILCITFHWTNQIPILTLTSLGLLFKLLIIIIMRRQFNQQQYFILPILNLVNVILYTETNFLLISFNNQYTHHTNTLFILFNLKIINKFRKTQKELQFIIYCFPLYIILRMFSLIFITFNYFILESLVAILIFSLLYLTKQQPQKIESLQQQNQIQDESGSKGIFSKKQQETSIQLRANIKSSSSQLFFQNDNSKDKEKSDQGSCLLKKRQSEMSGFGNQIKKKQSLEIDKIDLQLGYSLHYFQSLFPIGIMIINQNHDIQYMNLKCEKLFGCQGQRQVLETLNLCLKQISLADEIHNPPISPSRQKITMNQQTLEDILKMAKNNGEQLEILDILLFPSKYINHYYPNELERSSFEESPKTETTSTNLFTFNIQFKREQENHKKLQLNIITQQFIKLGQQQEQQNNLIIIIKNKYKSSSIKKLKNQNQIYHQILQKISYDIRSPLNSVQFIQNVIQEVIQDKQIEEYIHVAQSSLLQLTYQINDILDYNAICTQLFYYKFNKFYFLEIITEIENIFIQQVQQKNITFTIKYHESLKDKLITSDKQRIIQVLINLLNNSCKFTKQNGDIIIIFSLLDDSVLEVTIQDTGIGIDQKVLSQQQNYLENKQNKTFYSKAISEKYIGVGLFLASKLIQGLIETNDNILEIQSVPQRGTKISFWIQDLQGQNQKDSSRIRNSQITGKFVNVTRSGSQFDNMIIKQYPDQIIVNIDQSRDKEFVIIEGKLSYESPSMQEDYKDKIIIPESNYFSFKSSNDNCESKGLVVNSKSFSFKLSTLQVHECTQFCKKILIVDDIPFNQIAMKLFLNHIDVQCDQAYDGYQAIQKVKDKCQTSCQNYEIIFMDIEMPGINGFEASKEIFLISNKKPVIVICTAYDSIENMDKGNNTGIAEFLSKPISSVDLLKILKKYQLIYVNTIRPIDNSAETYSYYKLPYCQPDNVQQVIETLGQSLSGDQKMESFYKFNYEGHNINDQKVCEQSFTKDDINKFIDAIDQNYIIEFYLQDIIMKDIVGILDNGQYYLKNRITFNLYIDKENILKFANITKSDSNSEFIKINKFSDQIIIPFYFSILVKEINQIEIDGNHKNDIRWKLLMFKGLIICVLFTYVSSLFRKTVLKEFQQLPDEENEIEEKGWRCIKIESLMPPINKILFSALLGNGMHFLITIFILLCCGSCWMFENHKGSVKSTGIIIYCFAGIINGYYTGRFYKFFGGRSWLLNLFISIAIFPISTFSILLMIDILGWLFDTTTTYSFTAVFTIIFILCVVYVPLSLIGGVVGRLRTIDSLFEKGIKKKSITNDIEFLKKGLIYGLISFISIIFELYYILQGTWGDQHFHQFTLILFAYIQLLIIIGLLSIIQTYEQLNKGNHNWQWICFINGGMCTIYIFLFLFFYYNFVNMHGFFQFFYYSAESLLSCFVLWLILGTTSYWTSLKFVIYLYSQNKTI